MHQYSVQYAAISDLISIAFIKLTFIDGYTARCQTEASCPCKHTIINWHYEDWQCIQLFAFSTQVKAGRKELVPWQLLPYPSHFAPAG